MGLLKNLVSWAVGSYPVLGKPWDSTPMRSTPINAYATPETTEPAEYYNDTIGKIIDQVNTINVSLAGAAVQNWPFRSGLDFTPGNPTAGCWDSGAKIWSVGMFTVDTGTSRVPTIFQSTDNGATFSQLSPMFVGGVDGDTIAGMCSDDGGNLMVFQQHQSSGNGNANSYYWNGSAWTNPSGTSTSSALGAGNVNPTGFHSTTPVARFCFFSAPQPTATPANSCMFNTGTTAGISGHVHASPPTGFTNITKCIVARQPGTTLALYFPCTQTSTGCADYLYLANFEDSSTWLNKTLPSGLVSTSTCNGLAYNSAQGLWMVAWDDGMATTFAISPDGIAWTTTAGTISNFTGTDVLIFEGLHAIGPIWYARTAKSGYISADNGATWTETQRGATAATAKTLLNADQAQLLFLGAALVEGSGVIV